MRKLKSLINSGKHGKQSSLYLVLLFIIIILSTLLTLKFSLEYRPYNTDIYQQLAVINHFKPIAGHISDPFFGIGPTDLHAGPYNYLIYLVSIFDNISAYQAVLMMTVFNIAFFTLTVYFFAKSFKFNEKQTLTLLTFMLLGWGSYQLIFAGLFDYTNLLVTGAYPATLGLTLIILLIGLAKRVLTNKMLVYLWPFTLIISSLLYSHILSGVIALFFVFLMVLTEVFKDKSINKYHYLLCLSVGVSILISFFIWPPFNLLSLIHSSQTVHVGKVVLSADNNFQLQNWPAYLGITILGVVFFSKLLKDKQYFISLLTLSSAVMTASYLLPIRLSLFWRFFPFIFFGLSVILSIYLPKYLKKSLYIVLLAVAIIGFLNTSARFHELLQQPVQEPQQYAIWNLPKNTMLLSDPNTSYHFAAMLNIRVVSIPYTHANPANASQYQIRYTDTANFFLHSSTPEQQEKFVDKYNVDYLLLNKNYYPDFLQFENDRAWLTNFKLLIPNKLIKVSNGMYLYKIVNAHSEGAQDE